MPGICTKNERAKLCNVSKVCTKTKKYVAKPCNWPYNKAAERSRNTMHRRSTMKIYTLIQTIKANSGSVWNGREICADTTRDKVLWGGCRAGVYRYYQHLLCVPCCHKKGNGTGMQFHCCARGFVLEPRRPDGLAGKKYGIPEEKKHCWKRAVSVSGAIMIMFMRGSGWTVHCTMVFFMA